MVACGKPLGNLARGKTIGVAQVLVFPLASPFPGHAENRGLTSDYYHLSPFSRLVFRVGTAIVVFYGYV